MNKVDKKNQSYRLETEQIEQLDILVKYYQNEFGFKLSKANILERLIKLDYERLKEEGKIE